MISKERFKALKYLKKEFDSLQNYPSEALGYTVGLNEDRDIFHWKISLMGPLDTPYAGGMFFLTVDFPERYPEFKPEVKFINKIYHLNVSPSNGHVDINILNAWKPETPFYNVLTSIFILFYKQNPSCAYSSQMAREYESNRKEFNRKAKEWTQKFAPM